MIQTINVGLTANDGLGDKLRNAMIIINDNFAQIEVILDTCILDTDIIPISQIGGLQAILDSIQAELLNIPTIQVDINSINTSIFNINSTLTSQNTSITTLFADITNLQNQINLLVEEAPVDGQLYARRNAGWETFNPSVHTHVEADITDLDKYTQLEVDVFLADKVDKITGKGLSEENYTSTEKSKLASITDSVKQKTINTSRSALASDNGCLIKIKGNATYTIDKATLPTGWNVIVRSFTGATGTFVASVGTTFDAPTGLILKPLKMCSIIKDSDDNKILINGETSLT